MSIAEWTPLETENGWPLQNELQGLRERLRDTAASMQALCDNINEFDGLVSSEYLDAARAILKRLKEEGLA